MAQTMKIKIESLKRRIARMEIDSPHPAPQRGRPRKMTDEIIALFREEYLKHYGQWGPAHLSEWAKREGLGSFHPTTIGNELKDLIPPEEPKAPPRKYEITLPDVMWSEDGTGFKVNGKKKELLILQDECSRFKLNTRLVNGPATAQDVYDYLKEAFEIYGPPLILKHDGDKIFQAKIVQDLLDDHRVVSLTSPPYYPPFNGKMERGIRDVKSYVTAMKRFTRGLSLEEMIDESCYDLNDLRPRPVLGGYTSREVYEGKKTPLPDRDIFYNEVMKLEAKLMDDAASRKELNEARRIAVEVVLYRYEMMKEYLDVSTYFEAKKWTN